VIGDRAAELGLNAFAAAHVPPSARPILTHCQVLRHALLPRMRRAGVVADVQPQFVTTDSVWAEKRLPPHLLKYAYCWKTLLKYGIAVAGGSDSPIGTLPPIHFTASASNE
jgi:predicted amidohydrolase YtcJ